MPFRPSLCNRALHGLSPPPSGPKRSMPLLPSTPSAAEPCSVSPSRLMSASWRLRSATEPGHPIYTLPRVSAAAQGLSRMLGVGLSQKKVFRLAKARPEHASVWHCRQQVLWHPLQCWKVSHPALPRHAFLRAAGGVA